MAQEATAVHGGPGPVAVIRDGVTVATWTARDLASVPMREVPGDSGSARDAWALPDLTRALIDGDARVVAVSSRDGVRAEVSADAWTTPEQVPVLRANRRGLLKFYWVIDGKPQHDGEVRDVSAIELAP